MPLHQLVCELNACLVTTLVAFLANLRSRQVPARWAAEPADPGHAEPRDETEQRLRPAHQVYRAMEANEGEHAARQWLVGGQAPAERIRALDARSVLGALHAFLQDTGGD